MEAFTKVIKAKLLTQDRTLAKSYLNLLVDEIIVKDYTAMLKGSYQAIAYAASQEKIKMGHSIQVPTFINDWCARRESNPRPLASETNTLSS